MRRRFLKHDFLSFIIDFVDLDDIMYSVIKLFDIFK